MDDFLRRIYLSELLGQAENAIASITQLNAYLAARHLTAVDRVNGVLRALDDFLGDAARMRLMLWPPRKAAEARGASLRAVLQIDDGHPLQNATLRHHLEHFDERLDAWARESPNRIYVDRNVGPRNMIGGVDPRDIIRQFVPEENVYIFRGEEFDIQALVTSVDELIPKIRSQLDELLRRRGG